jgi:Uma2 family endonuclease
MIAQTQAEIAEHQVLAIESPEAVHTAEELSRLPSGRARYELVRGELRTMPPASHGHGGIAGLFHIKLGNYVLEHKLGRVYSAETGFLLTRNPDTVRAPDIAFIRQERVSAQEGPGGYWPGAPDLAAEVISPGDLYTEVAEKVEDWLDAGTRMVVVIDPRKRHVTIYRSKTEVEFLTEADTLNGGEVVPGWQLPVAEIFA